MKQASLKARAESYLAAKRGHPYQQWPTNAEDDPNGLMYARVLELEQEQAADALWPGASAGPPEPKPDEGAHPLLTPGVGWVTGHRGVAAYYGITDPAARERLRAVIARWRVNHRDDWRQDDNPKASGTYLYRVDALRQPANDLKRRDAKRVQGGRNRPSPVRLPRKLA